MDELSILLVEDNEIDVVFFQRSLALAEANHTVTVSKNGEEAIEVLESVAPSDVPHLVFIDINLPGISGIELLEQIRRTRAMDRAVVFMLTTSDEKSDVDAAYANHAAGYIVKSLSARSKIASLVDWYSHSNHFCS